MQHSPANNLISAYFDDEVTPRERALAARLLRISPTAATEFEEIADLSALLRSLPREPAPPEVAQSVSRRACCRTPDSAKLSMRAFLKRAATCAVGGLVTAAAGLLMMMGIHTNSTTARHEPLLTSSGATTAPVDTVSQVWPPFDNTHSEFKERSRTVGRAGAGMPAIANDAIASLDTSDLKSARPGEVIAYLEQSDGRATVIRATVVDVRQAVGQTRLLLARQEIPNVNEPDSVEEPTRGMRRRFRSNADVFAVYVESTGPQLAAALEQLRRDANFVELRLQPPMDLAHVPVIDPAESPDADAKPRRDASFQLLVNIPEETLRNLDPGVILGSSVNDRPDDRVERAGARLRDHAQSIRGAQPDRVRVLLVFEQRVSG